MALTIRCRRPGAAAAARPRMAMLLASVPPLVKQDLSGSAPSRPKPRPARRSRARSGPGHGAGRIAEVLLEGVERSPLPRAGPRALSRYSRDRGSPASCRFPVRRPSLGLRPVPAYENSRLRSLRAGGPLHACLAGHLIRYHVGLRILPQAAAWGALAPGGSRWPICHRQLRRLPLHRLRHRLPVDCFHGDEKMLYIDPRVHRLRGLRGGDAPCRRLREDTCRPASSTGSPQRERAPGLPVVNESRTPCRRQARKTELASSPRSPGSGSGACRCGLSMRSRAPRPSRTPARSASPAPPGCAAPRSRHSAVRAPASARLARHLLVELELVHGHEEVVVAVDARHRDAAGRRPPRAVLGDRPSGRPIRERAGRRSSDAPCRPRDPPPRAISG